MRIAWGCGVLGVVLVACGGPNESKGSTSEALNTPGCPPPYGVYCPPGEALASLGVCFDPSAGYCPPEGPQPPGCIPNGFMPCTVP
jgi:hypothetical protein